MLITPCWVLGPERKFSAAVVLAVGPLAGLSDAEGSVTLESSRLGASSAAEELDVPAPVLGVLESSSDSEDVASSVPGSSRRDFANHPVVPWCLIWTQWSVSFRISSSVWGATVRTTPWFSLAPERRFCVVVVVAVPREALELAVSSLDEDDEDEFELDPDDREAEDEPSAEELALRPCSDDSEEEREESEDPELELPLSVSLWGDAGADDPV
ncbi:hypothetical protein [Nesterenkonia pannonica]|uniref:hypothetical protein n=1 Tax=Nesterenkonia pannonica TaxID=1548602 RepID=UPI002164D840|nr:hypothetical protein [Nesterenkonia pannonica]